MKRRIQFVSQASPLFYILNGSVWVKNFLNIRDLFLSFFLVELALHPYLDWNITFDRNLTSFEFQSDHFFTEIDFFKGHLIVVSIEESVSIETK